ncbi:hypothetical protein [Pedobacter hartonius]|uniref:Uncharacterized protein n=1 Tax=Pedobacter hartonius TaxID=425514 RepID=A0A1H4G5I9_9SPHI|nr:hypothetical protein [Pedobacter hartonius]SEB04551.1 hypothetical protein SAMN05443550_10934 [Pedobacter hartonius]
MRLQRNAGLLTAGLFEETPMAVHHQIIEINLVVYGSWGLPGKPKAHRKYFAAGLLLFTAAGLLALRGK